MKKLLVAALAAVALYACTPATPCTDAECLSLAGRYSATWDIDSGTLDRLGDGGVCTFIVLSGWDLTQSGSTLGLDSSLMSMTGTLYTGGSFTLSGGENGISGSISGSATGGTAGADGGVSVAAQLRGQLIANTVDSDGNTCLSNVSFEATQL